MAHSLRLEADELETLALTTAAGYVVEAFDLGDAVTREVAENAPDADGTIDTTQHTGARAVTINLNLLPDVDALSTMVNRLRAYTSPRIRPRLFVQFEAGSPELMLTLRRSQFSSPVSGTAHAPITVQWVAPSGILESATLHSAAVQASDEGSEPGVGFDWDFSLDFTDSPPIGTLAVANAGTTDAYPLLRLYGPCTGPRIANVTQGKTLDFDAGYVIAAGHFVEIDTRAKTIRLDGDAAASVYDELDFPASAWWSLSPGDNEIRFYPVSFSTPSYAAVEYRDAYL